jgi:hypothetical protein
MKKLYDQIASVRGLVKARPILASFPFWTVYAVGVVDQAMNGDHLLEGIE